MFDLQGRALRFAINLGIKKKGLKWVIDEYSRLGDKYDIESGKKFASAEEEVAKMIKTIPSLKPAEETLVRLTRNYRIAKGLPA